MQGEVGHTQRGAHLLAAVIDQIPVLHVIHQVEKDLYCCQHDCRIGMLKVDDDALCHYFCI